MAELTKSTDDAATSSCCAPAQQAECCEPSDKAECCKPESSSCGCIAGALTRYEFEQALLDGGLEDVEITETHRVHDRAGSAIIRARKPT